MSGARAGTMREDERAPLLDDSVEDGVGARRATRWRGAGRAYVAVACVVGGMVACVKMGAMERVTAMGRTLPHIVPVCNRATLEAAILGTDGNATSIAAAERDQPVPEMDFTYVNGFWHVPGKQHHPFRWYAPASLTTACLMGALGAKSVFVRSTRAECDQIVSVYRSGAEFDDKNIPGLDRMYGARDVDKVKCVVKKLAELPLSPNGCKLPYYRAWINKVTTLGDMSKMVHFGQGFEKLRSSNYFWIDSDAAAPGDFHWQYQNFNTVAQMSRHLTAAKTGISPACYHGTRAFSRPMSGGCDKVGDVVANFFGGSYDSVQYFDQKYREFVHALARARQHSRTFARRLAPRGKHAASMGTRASGGIGEDDAAFLGFQSHKGCPREEWIMSKLAAREYRNANSSERSIFSKQSCIYEDPSIGPETILHTRGCPPGVEHSHM